MEIVLRSYFKNFTHEDLVNLIRCHDNNDVSSVLYDKLMASFSPINFITCRHDRKYDLINNLFGNDFSDLLTDQTKKELMLNMLGHTVKYKHDQDKIIDQDKIKDPTPKLKKVFLIYTRETGSIIIRYDTTLLSLLEKSFDLRYNFLSVVYWLKG